MTQEEFRKVYKALSENNPERKFEYDGDRIISTQIMDGIPINIYNHEIQDGRNSWELELPDFKISESQIKDYWNKRDDFEEYVQYVIDETLSKIPHEISVTIYPKDILRLKLRYFVYGDGKMAFGLERYVMNFVTEKLLM